MKVDYKRILDWYMFRVPQKGSPNNEYTTSFKDFDITFTFKEEEMDVRKTDMIIKFLKKMKNFDEYEKMEQRGNNEEIG
jgi:hypothetical protein